MSRVPPLVPSQMSPAQREIQQQILQTRGGTWFHGPYDALLHQPSIAAPAQELGSRVRFHTGLAPRLSELAILVVARHWDCDFEWYQHAPIAAAAGLPAGTLEALRIGTCPSALTDDELAVWRFTTALLKQHRIADAEYDDAKARFGTTALVGLTALIGYYTFLAFTLLAHDISLPADSAPPLTGAVPPSATSPGA